MVSRAIARYLRISPRKTRKVIDLVRGLPVVKAEAVLDVVDKRPTSYVKRLLRSAIDSASKRLSLSPADLYISLIKADQGPMLKRFRAASMGRATMIKHRTTHIVIELEKIKRPEKKETSDKQPLDLTRGRQATKKRQQPVKKQKTQKIVVKSRKKK